MPEYSGIYLVENCVAERKRGKIMNLLYKSTRNSEKTVTASEAILKGLADDGGLFVPESIPKLDVTLDELKGMSYQETAYAVMKQFFTDFTEEELKHLHPSGTVTVTEVSTPKSPPSGETIGSSGAGIKIL